MTYFLMATNLTWAGDLHSQLSHDLLLHVQYRGPPQSCAYIKSVASCPLFPPYVTYRIDYFMYLLRSHHLCFSVPRTTSHRLYVIFACRVAVQYAVRVVFITSSS